MRQQMMPQQMMRQGRRVRTRTRKRRQQQRNGSTGLHRPCAAPAAALQRQLRQGECSRQ